MLDHATKLRNEKITAKRNKNKGEHNFSLIPKAIADKKRT